MTASLSGVYNAQNFTSLGVLAVGGRLYTYSPGTTTHKTAYTDAAASVAHTYTSDGIGGQYIAMDARGELPASLFLTAGGSDIAYKTATGSTVWTRQAVGQDDLPSALDAALRADLLDDSSAAKGPALMGYEASLAYAPKTVGKALKTHANVMDAIPSNLWAAIEAETSAVDVYSYIQTAVTNNPKKDLFVPGGLYRFTRGFYLKTGQTLYGEGGSKFKAIAGSWVGTTGVLGTAPFVWNENNNTTTLTDKDIGVENMEFDYDTVVVIGGGAHAVRFRAVDRPRVINSRFNKGENGTAFLACRDSLVDECEAYDVINCFYDHWDGAISGTVRNCIGRNTVDMAQGIQFTGTGSSLEDRNSLLFLATGNRLFGVRNSSSHTASAIIFNSNDAGSSVVRCISALNYIEDADLGWVAQGLTGQHESIGDTFRNVDQLPIFMQADASGSPSYCRVIDPHLIDCSNAAGNIAMVSVDGTGNRVKGIRVTNTGAVAYEAIARLASSSVSCSVQVESATSGTSTRVANESATGVVYDRADMDFLPKQIPTVASAGTIAPTTGIAYISGVATISTITVPDGLKQGGPITLIPTGLWATNTAGNIALGTTAVVNKALLLTYDPNTAKFYPSY